MRSQFSYITNSILNLKTIYFRNCGVTMNLRKENCRLKLITQNCSKNIHLHFSCRSKLQHLMLNLYKKRKSSYATFCNFLVLRLEARWFSYFDSSIKGL